MSFILLTQGFYCKNNGLNGNELRDFVCLYTLADLRFILLFMLLRIAQHANHDEDSYFQEMRQHKGEHNVARNNDNEDNFVNNNNIIYIIANSRKPQK